MNSSHYVSIRMIQSTTEQMAVGVTQQLMLYNLLRFHITLHPGALRTEIVESLKFGPLGELGALVLLLGLLPPLMVVNGRPPGRYFPQDLSALALSYR